MVQHNGPSGPSELQVLNDVRSTVPGFEQNPYLRLGDTDSAHGVIFGHSPVLGDVAVKPFMKFTRARQEARNLTAIQEHGFLALDPIEVAQGGLCAYLITARIAGLRHLGQVNWNADVASKQLKTVIEPTLAMAADAAGSWHAAGITNGDMQAKNMIFNASGQSVYVDAEKARWAEPAPQRTRAADKDIGLFGASLFSKGLLDDRSPSYRAGYLATHFLDPYLERAGTRGFDATPDERRNTAQNQWIRMIGQGRPRWASGPTQRKLR